MYPEGTTTISVYQSQSAWFSSFPPLSGLLPLQLALLWLVLAPLQIQNRIRNQNKTYQRHLVPVPLRKKQLQLLQVSSPLQLLLLLFRQQVLSELFPRPNGMRKRIFHNSNTFSSIISCFFTSFLFLFALFAICQQIINNGSITKEINEAVQQNFWHTKCTNNHGYFKKKKIPIKYGESRIFSFIQMRSRYFHDFSFQWKHLFLFNHFCQQNSNINNQIT